LSVRKITLYGNKILRKKAEKIPKVSKKIIKLIEDMFDTTTAYDGIGLAAPQIGISKAVVVIDLSQTEFKEKLVLINPVIKRKYGDLVPFNEGCLSFPKLYADVVRPSTIDLEFTDIKGKKQKFNKINGLIARVAQHEVDHLNGILFIDKISKSDYNRLKNDLEKIKKQSLLNQ
jgi:peptide deformylase